MPDKAFIEVLDAALEYAETRADRGCRHSIRFKYQQILPITS
jgi:hypothetical protein